MGQLGMLLLGLREGFEKKLEELYHKYQKGEVSLGYLAEAIELLEERGLRTTNWPETPPDLDSISRRRRFGILAN